MPFPWTEAMGFGFGVLRLDAAGFWAMTPRELACAYQGLMGRSSTSFMNRSTFLDLMSAFPDEPIGATL